MSEADVSALVGEVYDAALDPTLWPSALQKICDFVPGVYANIFIQDANNRFANSVFTWGGDPVYFQSYLDKYAKLNPVFPAAFFQKVGDVFSVLDLVSPDELTRTRFYKEWIAPQGIFDGLISILEKSSTSCAVLGVTQAKIIEQPRHEILERMRMIVPHVRRAVLIGKAFHLQKAIAADLTASMDALNTAIFLVDAQGRLMHANSGGMTMIAEDNVLSGSGGRLHACDPTADRSLAELFAASASGNDLAVGSRGAAIHMPARDGKDHVGHVLPLMAGARRNAAAPHRAVATLVVHAVAQNQWSPPEVIAKAFGLTPREVGILLALVETPGVTEVAEILGLSAHTVRTHLRAIFTKTGTSRQAELVKLVAQFMSPFV